jgi:hypothetical protein
MAQRVAATFKLDDPEAFVDQWYKDGATQEVFSLIRAGSVDRLRAELERRLRPTRAGESFPGSSSWSVAPLRRCRSAPPIFAAASSCMLGITWV